MMKQNPSFQSYGAVNDIVSILKPRSQLHYFGFCRIYPDGKFFNLASDYRWPEYHFLEKNYPPAGVNNYDSIIDGAYLPADDQDCAFGWPTGVIHSIKERFSVKDPLLLSKKYADCIELALFSLDRDDAHSHFMANLDIFKRFLFYFKDKAAPLLQEADAELLYISNPASQLIPNTLSTKEAHNELDFSIHHYPYHCNGRWIELTPKQEQVLGLLARGKTYKGVAEELAISPRTVESYIQSLMQKFNTSHKQVLADYYWENQLQ